MAWKQSMEDKIKGLLYVAQQAGFQIIEDGDRSNPWGHLGPCPFCKAFEIHVTGHTGGDKAWPFLYCGREWQGVDKQDTSGVTVHVHHVCDFGAGAKALKAWMAKGWYLDDGPPPKPQPRKKVKPSPELRLPVRPLVLPVVVSAQVPTRALDATPDGDYPDWYHDPDDD